jgi:hypothetical protein
MTEEEWLASSNPDAMLRILGEGANTRKMQLFTCACCRRIWRLIRDERSRRAIEVAEDFADNRIDEAQFQQAVCAAHEADEVTISAYEQAKDEHERNEVYPAIVGARAASIALLGPDLDDDVPPSFAAAGAASFARDGYATTEAAEKDQAWLLREIFGNLFRSITLGRAWLTSSVVAVAQAIYEDKAFNQLPILADALEDAGCTNADILAHCRERGVHVRGCWVLDLLLDKT